MSAKTIACPRGHFLGELLLDPLDAVWAERRRCKQCRQDVFLVVANGTVSVRSAVQ